MLTSYVFILSTQYYTDYEYAPVRSIAAASTTGHGTNIITGVAVGMKSTVVPTVMVSIAVLTAYHLGASSGLGDGHNAGLFGTAVATMGLLCSAGFVLSMNNYGPIADNAGGIAEMSQQPERVRVCTDRLDAAGNVTKAITKGYSIGSASLACFVLFGAFMDDMSAYAHRSFDSVDISTPEVLVGGLLGVMMIFLIVGLAVAAVGKTAGDVVKEVRRQFKEHPEIMEWKAKPDSRACVELVTRAALREMRFPGILAVAVPTFVGVMFRFIGEMTDRPLLGAEALGGFMMFATVTGILMALFLDNVGGAWDNAKSTSKLAISVARAARRTKHPLQEIPLAIRSRIRLGPRFTWSSSSYRQLRSSLHRYSSACQHRENKKQVAPLSHDVLFIFIMRYYGANKH